MLTLDDRIDAVRRELEAKGEWVSADARVTDKVAATMLLGVSLRTLARWREEGIGPPATVIRRRVSYSLRGLLEYVDRQTLSGTSRAA